MDFFSSGLIATESQQHEDLGALRVPLIYFEKDWPSSMHFLFLVTGVCTWYACKY
jgi:ATP adenylyltransferase/5',5'''-P-1,P-4-tetraphosphate phosphorylase II